MDDLYIKRVLNGDVEAYGYLIRQHQGMAMRTAMAIVKREADAKDVVQESFIQAYESLGKFRQEAQFSSWICRIVINNSLKWKSKNKFHTLATASFMSAAPLAYNQGALRLSQQDLQQLLKAALQLLPPKEALCVQLFYLEEYSIAEIVQLTGFSLSNVKVLMHRGRNHLSQHLQQHYEKLK